jgi:hypothetical protein
MSETIVIHIEEICGEWRVWDTGTDFVSRSFETYEDANDHAIYRHVHYNDIVGEIAYVQRPETVLHSS